MEDDKEELKEDIRHLHVDMLRQFQEQQVHCVFNFSESVNPPGSVTLFLHEFLGNLQANMASQLKQVMDRVHELYEENKLLREENARLKSVY